MPRERGDNGKFQRTVSQDDVLEVLTQVRGPVVTSSDVADALGVTHETARRKLNRLTEASTLDKRKIGGRMIYWPVNSGRDDSCTR